MSNKKLKLCMAGGIILMAFVMKALGFNSFIESIGFLAAGYLFGTAGQVEPPKKDTESQIKAP